MSDREFENYLALLASLLRLDRRQRGKIAEELRAHLEDRLDELLAEGMPREEAIRQALAEFGDAAGLAAEFKTLSWNRKRRWLMRVTTFSVAATLLLAAGIVTFWPGRNAGPGVAQLGAQDAEKEVARDPFGAPPPKPQAKARGTRTLEDVLQQRVEFEFVETPLVDVIAFIGIQHEIGILLKGKELEEAGIAPDEPVTKSLKGVRLSTALDLMLDELDLTYVEVEGEMLLVITTPEDAETTMQVRVYDCRDLLSMEAPAGASKYVPAAALPSRGFGGLGGAGGIGGGGLGGGGMGGGGGFFAVEDEVPAPAKRGGTNSQASPAGASSTGSPGDVAASNAVAVQGGFGGGLGEGAYRPMTEHDLRAERLIDILQGNIDPDSWNDIGGGPGSIGEYNGLVVVTQSARTHKKIERVLDMLREAAGLEKPKGGGVVR
jgi:hypothetical protein